MSDSDTTKLRSYVLDVTHTRDFLESFAKANHVPVGRAIEMAVFAMMTELGLGGENGDQRAEQAVQEYQRLNLRPQNDESDTSVTVTFQLTLDQERRQALGWFADRKQMSQDKVLELAVSTLLLGQHWYDEHGKPLRIDFATDEHTTLMLEDDEELLSAIVITHKGY